MEKWGNSKVYLAVVSAEQQSGLILNLLITFGLVSLAMGNSQHTKGNEVGDGETPLLALNCLQPYRDPVQLSQVQALCDGKGWVRASIIRESAQAY